jgi:short chain dehydrogenase
MQERNPKSLPPQHQDHQPGDESEMIPRPDFMPRQAGSGRLKGKTALITGGDSGIGRAVSVLFAREGAQIAIVYLEEDDDAKETEAMVRKEGADCLLIKGDVGSARSAPMPLGAHSNISITWTCWSTTQSPGRAGQQRRRAA